MTPQEKSKAAYELAKSLFAEAERQGREGEKFHGEPLRYSAQYPEFRNSYERELKYGGKYFCAGLYLGILTTPAHAGARATRGCSSSTPCGDSTGSSR